MISMPKPGPDFLEDLEATPADDLITVAKAFSDLGDQSSLSAVMTAIAIKNSPQLPADKSLVMAMRMQDMLQSGDVVQAAHLMRSATPDEVAQNLKHLNLHAQDMLPDKGDTFGHRPSVGNVNHLRKQHYDKLVEALANGGAQETAVLQIAHLVDEKMGRDLGDRFRLWLVNENLDRVIKKGGTVDMEQLVAVLQPIDVNNPLAAIAREINYLPPRDGKHHAKNEDWELHSSYLAVQIANRALASHCLPIVELATRAYTNFDPIEKVLNTKNFSSPWTFEETLRFLDTEAKERPVAKEEKSLMQRIKDMTHPPKPKAPERLTLDLCLHHLAALPDDVSWKEKLSSLLVMGVNPLKKDLQGKSAVENIPRDNQQKRDDWESISKSFAARRSLTAMLNDIDLEPVRMKP